MRVVRCSRRAAARVAPAWLPEPAHHAATGVLPRDHRLAQAAGFTAAVRNGRRAGSRLLVVHLDGTAAAPGERIRVGFIVSKAVGPAVVRTRVKRRLRHLVRNRLAALPSSGSLVVRALPAAAGATSAELGSDLDRCLVRVLGMVREAQA